MSNLKVLLRRSLLLIAAAMPPSCRAADRPDSESRSLADSTAVVTAAIAFVNREEGQPLEWDVVGYHVGGDTVAVSLRIGTWTPETLDGCVRVLVPRAGAVDFAKGMWCR